MDRQRARPLAATGVVLVLVVLILIVGGLSVRRYTAAAFRLEEQARSARELAFPALRYQIDEESGIRGFAATGRTEFLEPYNRGREALPPLLGKLDAALAALGLDAARASLADARATNAEWARTVAVPLLARRPKSATALQRHGKALVDRYRAEIGDVQNSVVLRERGIDSDIARAIDRINTFVLTAVIAIAVGGIMLGMQQARLSRRLWVKQRETAELSAAYEAEKRIAEILQEAFLQRPLPTVSAVSFSATYVPASDEAKVGGDWYEGVEMSKDRVMFVIGDVAGHGLEAAVAMNRARQTLISAALVDADPGPMLARANAELLRQNAQMVTVVCGHADASTYEFTYASAGHPPPILIEPGQPPRMLEFGGLPLAVMDAALYRTIRVQSVPGAMLVLYTDGAVEHSKDVLRGESTLLEAVARSVADGAANPAAAIHDAIFTDRSVGDDVAILTVAFAKAGAGTAGGADTGAIVSAAARGRTKGVTGTVVSLVDGLLRKHAS